MKKSLIVLSIMSVLGAQAYAQNTQPINNSIKPVQSKDVPETPSLNKKVIKEGEKTQKDLKMEN